MPETYLKSFLNKWIENFYPAIRLMYNIFDETKKSNIDQIPGNTILVYCHADHDGLFQCQY